MAADDRSERATPPGRQGLPAAVERRLAACLAAAGALLGGARAAADVIPIAAPIDIFPGAPIDLDGDGNDDLSFFIPTYNATRYFQGLANAGRPAAALAAPAPQSYVSRLNTGQVISDAALAFATKADFGYAGSGNPSNGNAWFYRTGVTTSTGIIGGRFVDPADNQPRFFWLRVRLAQSSGSTVQSQILEGAFESSPGVAIAAGALPLSSSGGGGGSSGCHAGWAGGVAHPLGLLALGAAGVAALRRRRRPTGAGADDDAPLEATPPGANAEP